MGADLCHQENLFTASAPERPAQDGLSLAVVILPCVVEESNAAVDRLVDELHCRVQGRHIAEMMTTYPDSGNVRTRAPEFPINHVWRLPCRRCCSLPDTRDARYRSHSTCTDFEKVPSICFHLSAVGSFYWTYPSDDEIQEIDASRAVRRCCFFNKKTPLCLSVGGGGTVRARRA